MLESAMGVVEVCPGLSRFVVLCRAENFSWSNLERVAAHEQWPCFRISAFCFQDFCFQNDHLRQPSHYLRQTFEIKSIKITVQAKLCALGLRLRLSRCYQRLRPVS